MNLVFPNQIANRASTMALGQLVKQKNLILAFENTAMRNADLVLQESEKVDRGATKLKYVCVSSRFL